MFAELKVAIEIRRQVEDELTHPDLIKLHRQLDEAREIVRAFLLAGQARLHEGRWGGLKVAGWRATKPVYFPKEDDPSQSDRYLIVATADFPKPVSFKNRKIALDSAELVIVIKGDHHTETKATLYPATALYGPHAHNTMVCLAYAAEVVEMIHRDSYVGKTTLVPNPEK